MDFSILFSPTAIAIIVALVLLAMWLGYAVEKRKESNRKKLAHADEIRRLGDEYGLLVKELNKANIANINDINKEHEDKIAALAEKHAVALAKEVGQLNDVISGLRAEKEELNDTVVSLKESIKTAKMQNMFSISKSGEQLIRVVRSVQELAIELNETSKTVTDGEHSFFDEIKDQRDKEAVLSLTGFDKDIPSYEPVQEPAGDTASEDESDDGENKDELSASGFNDEIPVYEPVPESAADAASEDESGEGESALSKSESDNDGKH